MGRHNGNFSAAAAGRLEMRRFAGMWMRPPVCGSVAARQEIFSSSVGNCRKPGPVGSNLLCLAGTGTAPALAEIRREFGAVRSSENRNGGGLRFCLPALAPGAFIRLLHLRCRRSGWTLILKAEPVRRWVGRKHKAKYFAAESGTAGMSF
jgi:hypothetical protein